MGFRSHYARIVSKRFRQVLGSAPIAAHHQDRSRLSHSRYHGYPPSASGKYSASSSTRITADARGVTGCFRLPVDRNGETLFPGPQPFHPAHCPGSLLTLEETHSGDNPHTVQKPATAEGRAGDRLKTGGPIGSESASEAEFSTPGCCRVGDSAETGRGQNQEPREGLILKVGTAAQLSPPRPSQREHAEVGAFAAVLLSPATVGCSPRLGEERPQRESPGRMAVPPGSFTQALRVGSGRGPILRTALRGATSERVRHATGPTFPGRCDHQDQRSPEGASPPNISPDISPGMSPPSRTPVRSPTEATHSQSTYCKKSRKCLIFFGLRAWRWVVCGWPSRVIPAPNSAPTHQVEM